MGALDEAFAELASGLIGAVVDEKTNLRRRVRTYNPSTGAETEAITLVSVKMSPPDPFSKGQPAQTLTQVTTLQRIVARLDLENENASFAPINPTTDTVEVEGVERAILKVEPMMSGDQAAGWLLTLST